MVHCQKKSWNFVYPRKLNGSMFPRVGTESSYYFGDDPDDLEYHAWYKVNSESIHPVGQKNPNPWSLHDLYGNVRNG